MDNCEIKLVEDYQRKFPFRVDHCGFCFANSLYLVGGRNKQQILQNKITEVNVLTHEITELDIEGF